MGLEEYSIYGCAVERQVRKKWGLLYYGVVTFLFVIFAIMYLSSLPCFWSSLPFATQVRHHTAGTHPLPLPPIYGIYWGMLLSCIWWDGRGTLYYTVGTYFV